MASLPNGNLSSEVSNKRPLENGCVPKYKPRKVSAFREFPPGCGCSAVPMNLKPEENSSSRAGIMDGGVIRSETANAVVANGAANSGMADLMEFEAVRTSEMPKIAKLTEIKDSEIQNAKNSNIEVECQSHGAANSSVDVNVTESLDADAVVANGAVTSGVADLMESEAVGNSEIPKFAKLNETKDSEIQNIVGPSGVKSSNIEVECQSHEAVNNPIEIERDALLDAYVEKATATIMNGFSNDVEKLIPETNLIVVDTLNGMKGVTDFGGLTTLQELNVEKGLALNSGALDTDASVEEDLLLGSPQALPSLGGSIKPETSIKPKDKYRPRRVSAIRDFPPHCGTHVSLPVEEKQMVISENDCLNRIEKDELTPETAMTRNVSERGTTGDVLMTSQKECLDGLQNIPVKNEITETLKDGAGRGLLGETAEGGLMDFENCNRDLQHSIIERTGACPGSGTISKAVVDTSIKDTGGPVGKEITAYSPNRNDKNRPQCSDFSSENDSNRVIVHGLMAAPHCPWRNSKVALKNSDGGTSGQKMRQQNLSQIQKPEAVASNSNLNANYSGGPPLEEAAYFDSCDVDGSPRSLNFIDEGDRGGYDECVPEITPISMFKAVPDESDSDYVGPIGKDMIVYPSGDIDEMSPSHIPEDEVDREVVHGLMASPYCPWRKGKTVLNNSDGETSGENKKKKKKNFSWREKAKAFARRSNPKIRSSGSPSNEQNKVNISNDVDGSPRALMLADDGGDGDDGDFPTNSPANHKPHDFEVNLPPFGPKSSGHGDARNRVRAALMFFHTIYRKFLREEEANSTPEEEGKSKQSGKKLKRIDLMTANILKKQGKCVNTVKRIGQVPGVEVGDEFQYRVELAVVGIHFPYQSGIDSLKINDDTVATSIVASGGYSDNLDDADVLIYSGQGGNVIGKKQPEDQKLERGNKALMNSIAAKTPVRVVRGWKETKYVDPLDSKPKMVTTYIYDGLYTVTRCWTETGRHGKQVYQFELKRNPGQPELAWKQLKKSNKSKTRPGVCVADISGGLEPFPICAVNILDNEKPPQFNYISRMKYPDWYHPIPPAGCDCTGRCSGSKKCRCAVRNGGEIPYNRNGALVETKALVYECGPHCRCPASCYNRVTQRGIKIQLEVFKTESRGWGVRSLTSIPSGSFICEYAGELLEDKEAEQRIGNDEYLFDIGQNYIDSSNKPEQQEIAAGLMEEGGFTIDACQYGNVGRFINHSCSPNLHAQNVMYDHDDMRMPHIMLFAMENIPPLQELTYHYNYAVDEIRDSDGNVKVKKCCCGAAQCSGRLY